MSYTPNKENLTKNTPGKKVFHYCNSVGNPIFKTKEIFPEKIVFYPYNVNLSTDQVKPKRIKCIEFKGWETVESLPKTVKKTPSYGFKFESATQIQNLLFKKFPRLEKISISKESPTRFSEKTITFNWSDFKQLANRLQREKNDYQENRKHLVYKILSEFTTKVSKLPRTLKSGDLEEYLASFSAYDKISVTDIDAFSQIFSDLPTANITVTTHLIKTKEKIDVIYLDDIIHNFEKLLRTSEGDEEKWQKYFQSHTWTLNHLFPYEVILSKAKAYVGGKTLENEDGRIVDFLFQSGLKDNFALLEIKTPKTPLLKKTAYRAPDVFALSDELSGAVNQCLDQKDIFQREYGQKYKSLDPKAVLVVGQKHYLNKNQGSCFELYRSNQKNVQIVTFDELQSKLIGLHNILTGKARKTK